MKHVGRNWRNPSKIEDLPTYDTVVKQRDRLAEALVSLAFQIESELPHLSRYPDLAGSRITLARRAEDARAFAKKISTSITRNGETVVLEEK